MIRTTQFLLLLKVGVFEASWVFETKAKEPIHTHMREQHNPK